MMSRETPLRLRPIAAAVVRTARRHAWRILAVSIVVSAVTVAVELAADHLLSRASLATALAGSLSTSTVSLLGAVFLSGFLCRLVSDSEHGDTGHGDNGHRHPDPGRAGVAAVGCADPGRPVGHADHPGRFVALIIPGLIAIALLAVVGRPSELERQHAVAHARVGAPGPPQLLERRVRNAAAVPVQRDRRLPPPTPSGTTDVRRHLIVRSSVRGSSSRSFSLILVELCYRLIAAVRAVGRRTVCAQSAAAGGGPASDSRAR